MTEHDATHPDGDPNPDGNPMPMRVGDWATANGLEEGGARLPADPEYRGLIARMVWSAAYVRQAVEEAWDDGTITEDTQLPEPVARLDDASDLLWEAIHACAPDETLAWATLRLSVALHELREWAEERHLWYADGTSTGDLSELLHHLPAEP